MHLVHKKLYHSRLLSGPLHFSTGEEYIDSDPQVWLSSKLRSRILPSYEEDI